MTDKAPDAEPKTALQILTVGRRHFAMKNYAAAAETISRACEMIANEHGDLNDRCAEAYMWYGKALLGLSRQERRVLGDAMRVSTRADKRESKAKSDKKDKKKTVKKVKETETQSTTKDEEPGTSSAPAVKPETISEPADEPGTSSGPADKPEASGGSPDDQESSGTEEDVTVVYSDTRESDIDNLQLAWEMLVYAKLCAELARKLLEKRLEAARKEAEGGAAAGGVERARAPEWGPRGEAAAAALADTHLALGEVALESETYDEAVSSMKSCLDLQKELYRTNDRRIAETHYQIGLANSLDANFEDAIVHFRNAANILETRIKILKNPKSAAEDANVKRFSSFDPLYTVEAEIKDMKALLPELHAKIQDMMDYKSETIKLVRETLFGSNGAGARVGEGEGESSQSRPAADISHLVKRKRKSSEGDVSASPAKKVAT